MKLSSTQVVMLGLLAVQSLPGMIFPHAVTPDLQKSLDAFCLQAAAILGISNLFVNPNGSPACAPWKPAPEEVEQEKK